MKKINRFICVLLVAVVGFVGCYEDKGSYDNKDWTDFVTITGIEIPGSSYGRVTLSEGEVLSINPTVEYKAGVNPADFEFNWVMGGDTIASTLNLAWTITPTNIELLSGEAYFWLAIGNKVTGENWKCYATSNDGYYMVKVKITPTAMPLIGVMVYEKADGTLEWGSIQGSNPAQPQNFTTILTDMYNRYNPTRTIQGPFVGATLDVSQLSIYTNAAPDYGVMIQTTNTGGFPFGNYMGTIQDQTFTSTPTAAINAKNGYYNSMQEILIGNELFLLPMTSSYPYQLLDPNSTGSESGVAQVIGALPYTRNAHVTLQRMTNGDVYYYTYSESRGYMRQAVTDGGSGTLNVDEIVGLFREPTAINASEQNLRFFVVGRKGTTYTLYTYAYVQYTATPHTIEFRQAKDVTAWAGGMTKDAIWFTSVIPVGWNYAYIAKGKDLWRYSYEGMETPTVVKSFADDIVAVVPVPKASLISGDEELYTAVFTYNTSAKTGSMYVVNIRTENVTEYSSCVGAIPGKVLKYIPYFSN